MNRAARTTLKTTIADVEALLGEVDHILSSWDGVQAQASMAIGTIRNGLIDVAGDQGPSWRVIPLTDDEGAACVSDLAFATHVGFLADADRRWLKKLQDEPALALRDARAAISVRRLFASSIARANGERAAAYLNGYSRWLAQPWPQEELRRLKSVPTQQKYSVPTSAALADWVGLRPQLADLGNSMSLVDATEVASLRSAISAIDTALKDEESFRAAVRKACEAVRSAEVHRLLADMPVERLREATRERVRVSALRDARITTVAQVLARDHALEGIPGIGQTSAVRIRGAAQTLRQTTYDEMPVRIDINTRSAEATQLLGALSAWDAARTTAGATEDILAAEQLRRFAQRVDARHWSSLIVIDGDRTADEFRSSVAAVVRRAQMLAQRTPAGQAADPWDDFLARPADYYSMLAELGLISEDEEAAEGELPSQIVEAVRACELDTTHLSASLRGYQSFGARFALVQRKVILGDEMGLGKTVEALAVLTHLRAKGIHHSFVICPAAVLTNWIREVHSKSTLRAHRLHGGERERAFATWLRDGGVAVTTFDMLGWLQREDFVLPEVGCVVVDEAHYIKNPTAKRSRLSAHLIDHADRAVLLTGTPLENRLDEFRALVHYLRPDLTVQTEDSSPRQFRQQVAPAYLRRNQEAVLTELPELVQVEEWLPLTGPDAVAYRNAVADGNFMAMRQAAMLRPDSEKMKRLVEIVLEAEANGRKVIVFSQFRKVLSEVCIALRGKVFGPLTGAVPPAARQVMVDQFSQADDGAVLVSQIVAGGVGLNVQAASVVIICEPQVKPTTEWQAVARSRRMGQLHTVQVHRLLSEEGVDLRLREILATKAALFEDFARISDMADAAPEAYDVSESQLAREVIAAERERLFSMPTVEAGDAV